MNGKLQRLALVNISIMSPIMAYQKANIQYPIPKPELPAWRHKLFAGDKSDCPYQPPHSQACAHCSFVSTMAFRIRRKPTAWTGKVHSSGFEGMATRPRWTKSSFVFLGFSFPNHSGLKLPSTTAEDLFIDLLRQNIGKVAEIFKVWTCKSEMQKKHHIEPRSFWSIWAVWARNASERARNASKRPTIIEQIK